MGKQEYMARVPRCCSLQTWQAHFDGGLCFSVAKGVKNRDSICKGCDLTTIPEGFLLELRPA